VVCARKKVCTLFPPLIDGAQSFRARLRNVERGKEGYVVLLLVERNRKQNFDDDKIIYFIFQIYIIYSRIYRVQKF